MTFLLVSYATSKQASITHFWAHGDLQTICSLHVLSLKAVLRCQIRRLQFLHKWLQYIDTIFNLLVRSG